MIFDGFFFLLLINSQWRRKFMTMPNMAHTKRWLRQFPCHKADEVDFIKSLRLRKTGRQLLPHSLCIILLNQTHDRSAGSVIREFQHICFCFVQDLGGLDFLFFFRFFLYFNIWMHIFYTILGGTQVFFNLISMILSDVMDQRRMIKMYDRLLG